MGLVFVGMIALAAAAPPLPEGMRTETREAAGVACEVVGIDPRKIALELHWRQPDGTPYGSFFALNAAVEAGGRELVFAANAGIYARDHTPLGLHIEAGQTLEPLNRKTGGGNFFLKPNGVFCIDGAGAHVLETEAYHAAGLAPRLAVQSGPMLLIEGAFHPRFLPDSDSVYVRSGVGLRGDGEVVFALSREPINFHGFAALFKDGLGCTNALYLDGALSDFYLPAAGRTPPGLGYVGILAVTRPREAT